MIFAIKFGFQRLKQKYKAIQFACIAEARTKKDYTTIRGIKMSEDHEKNRREFCLKIRQKLKTGTYAAIVLEELFNPNGVKTVCPVRETS